MLGCITTLFYVLQAVCCRRRKSHFVTVIDTDDNAMLACFSSVEQWEQIQSSPPSGSLPPQYPTHPIIPSLAPLVKRVARALIFTGGSCVPGIVPGT